MFQASTVLYGNIMNHLLEKNMIREHAPVIGYCDRVYHNDMISVKRYIHVTL